MKPFDHAGIQLTLPCSCGASVAVALGGSMIDFTLICPRCGMNIHLHDRDTSVRRAMLTPNAALRRISKRIRRLQL